MSLCLFRLGLLFSQFSNRIQWSGVSRVVSQCKYSQYKHTQLSLKTQNYICIRACHLLLLRPAHYKETMSSDRVLLVTSINFALNIWIQYCNTFNIAYQVSSGQFQKINKLPQVLLSVDDDKNWKCNRNLSIKLKLRDLWEKFKDVMCNNMEPMICRRVWIRSGRFTDLHIHQQQKECKFSPWGCGLVSGSPPPPACLVVGELSSFLWSSYFCPHMFCSVCLLNTLVHCMAMIRE